MKIRYHTRKLEKSVGSYRAIKKDYGERAKKVNRRIEELTAAANLEDMRSIHAANCHELKADRVGKIAVDISPNHRIIFLPDHDPLPEKDDGGLEWKQVTSIVILAIGEDYH